MKKYYIEIGTCNFDTLTQEFEHNDNWIGICVDPIDIYLNDLPRRQNTFYENSAVILNSDKSEIDFYTIKDKALLDKFDWLKGASSFNPNHSNLQQYFTKISVNAITFENLIKKYNFYHQCDILKLDVEGLDASLVNQIYDFYTNTEDNLKLLPKKIIFEAKHCPHLIDDLIFRLTNHYNCTKHETLVKGEDKSKVLVLDYDIECILNEK